MEQSNEFEQFLNDIIFSLDSFNHKCISDNKTSNIISEGLNLLLGFNNTKLASLFLLNEDTFEFEHSSTIPSTSKKSVKDLFLELIENGTIGNVLSTTASKVYSNENENHYYLMPLLGSKGILGIFIIQLDTHSNSTAQILYRLLDIFSILFSRIYENSLLQEYNEKIRDVISQEVASRTMKLVQSKKLLMDKFADLKSNLTMSLPHEVRTPINLILGNSEYLKNNFSSIQFDDAVEILGDIYDAAKRLNRMFENYLYYSKLSMIATDSAAIHLYKEKYTLQVATYIENLVKYNIEFKARISDIKFELVEANVSMPEEFMYKVIIELTDNALKYSNPGSEILISSEIKNNSYEFRIMDHGRGMSKEQIENIEAYLQFDRSIHEQQGTGLGLAIVQRIADITASKLNIESVPEQYTTITLKIPIYTQTID